METIRWEQLSPHLVAALMWKAGITLLNAPILFPKQQWNEDILCFVYQAKKY